MFNIVEIKLSQSNVIESGIASREEAEYALAEYIIEGSGSTFVIERSEADAKLRYGKGNAPEGRT